MDTREKAELSERLNICEDVSPILELMRSLHDCAWYPCDRCGDRHATTLINATSKPLLCCRACAQAAAENRRVDNEIAWQRAEYKRRTGRDVPTTTKGR